MKTILEKAKEKALPPTQIGVRMSSALRDRLTRYCSDHGVRQADLIRIILQDYLDRAEKL